MSRKIDTLHDDLFSLFQRCHHQDDLCRVAPSPQLQGKITATLERMGLKDTAPPEAMAADTASVKGARKGGAKKAAKKGARKAAGGAGNVDEFVTAMLRLRQRTPPGYNDGLIVPGEEFPAGTPLRVVRNAALERAPLTGTVRVIVVLVNFSDKSMTRTKAQFESLFFSTGTIATGSVKEYFKEASGGAINLEGQVVGPFNLGNTMAHYAHGASGTGATEPNARTMAREAAVAANPTVNYAPFDNDGNGFVDAFVVIHAGPGAEVTGNVNHIWSHKWVLSGGALNADGTKIFAYLTVPEDSRIGVCAHELGHLLFGWPDLYDTDGSSEGIGNWCLMAGGSWNNGGDTPAHPSAWCKLNQGWATAVVQTTNASVSIPDVKTSKKVHRLWKDGAGGSEYFLVENRQKTKFDKFLPGAGLLIWHVDESITSNANEAHPKVALKQADGLKQLEAGVNRGDAGDPYPGTANNKTFNKASNPNSKSYGGVDTCVAVTNVSAPAATMTASLAVKCSVVKSLVKDITDNKSIIKDIDKLPDNKNFQVDKSLTEKLADKRIDKQPEKPVTDKSTGFDKNPVEGKNFTEKFIEGGLPGGGGFPGFGGAPEPFIGGELRPDLSEGALSGEEEYQEGGNQPQINSPQGKRLFDGKQREF
ncbi:MAG: M6 family metalloprotease domain-containing protein [Acidobacteria bacterium]|nr:M6 family metalloprotease domain-containing protein [Acidobacteriota bacterium]MCA1632838.1 M6 family metalloprotease domain-containing protein [Acidobacteriota bacterium]MCA1640974.1 M6 family metalloprotease domain-containing protein [Acidobacteriota bacterium]